LFIVRMRENACGYVELEAALGASEPTLAEYILSKYEESNASLSAFRKVLHDEAGIESIHVDRLHSLISTLKVWPIEHTMHFCGSN
jgi:hypothetical protein